MLLKDLLMKPAGLVLGERKVELMSCNGAHESLLMANTNVSTCVATTHLSSSRMIRRSVEWLGAGRGTGSAALPDHLFEHLVCTLPQRVDEGELLGREHPVFVAG